jgi:adenylosuccinate lyase
VAEHVGSDSRYIHWGLTSTDVVDTAQALQLLAVNERILAAIDEFMAVVKARAEEIRSVVNPQLQLRNVDAIFQRVFGS